MTLNLELTTELSRRLQREAERRGIAAENYVLRWLEEFLPRDNPGDPIPTLDLSDFSTQPPNSREERLLALEALENELDELTRDCPEIPLEALRRENMYADDRL